MCGEGGGQGQLRNQAQSIRGSSGMQGRGSCYRSVRDIERGRHLNKGRGHIRRAEENQGEGGRGRGREIEWEGGGEGQTLGSGDIALPPGDIALPAPVGVLALELALGDRHAGLEVRGLSSRCCGEAVPGRGREAAGDADCLARLLTEAWRPGAMGLGLELRLFVASRGAPSDPLRPAAAALLARSSGQGPEEGAQRSVGTSRNINRPGVANEASALYCEAPQSRGRKAEILSRGPFGSLSPPLPRPLLDFSSARDKQHHRQHKRREGRRGKGQHQLWGRLLRKVHVEVLDLHLWEQQSRRRGRRRSLRPPSLCQML